MNRTLALLLMGAVPSGCVTAPPAVPVVVAPASASAAKAPPVLLNFYKDADAYRVNAERRLCANPTLGPRLEALQRRLAAATQVLVSRYGREQIDAARVSVTTPGSDSCTNKAAAATSLNSLEAAVSDLEAALR